MVLQLFRLACLSIKDMQERLIGKHMLTDCFVINFKPQFQSFCQIFKAQNFF